MIAIIIISVLFDAILNKATMSTAIISILVLNYNKNMFEWFIICQKIYLFC